MSTERTPPTAQCPLCASVVPVVGVDLDEMAEVAEFLDVRAAGLLPPAAPRAAQVPIRDKKYDENNRLVLPHTQMMVWSCGICGPCPSSTYRWCDLGCGSDYPSMTQMPAFAGTRER